MKLKKKKGLLILLIVLSLALVFGLGWLVHKMSADAAPAKEIKIETPCCTLYFPGDWESQLQVVQTQGDPYVVSFYGKLEGIVEQLLFDVVFSEQRTKDVLGTVTGSDGVKWYVSIVLHSFEPDQSWSEDNKDIIFTMQEDINYLIGKLPLSEDEQWIPEETEATQPVVTEPPVYEPVVVDTPFGIMFYPGDRAQNLRIVHSEEEAYTVTFYADIDSYPEQMLFSFSFGLAREDAQWVRTLENGNVVGVDVVFGALQLEDWDDEARQLALVMQEAVNELMYQLELKAVEHTAEEETAPVETEGAGENPIEVTISQQTQQIPEGDFLVDTSYGQLKYPEKWRSYVWVDQDERVFSFYAKIGGHEDILLFRILFDSTEGVALGAVADNSGKMVSVNLLMYELVDGEDWTENEKNLFYAMQEDVNFLIEALPLVLE